MTAEQADSSHLAADQQLRARIDDSLRHPVMFFFTSGAAWLALTVVLALLRSVKHLFPGFFDCCAWLDAGRIDAAHFHALIYGWGLQAAFGVMLWLMARLSRRPLRGGTTVLVAGHFWNAVVSIGLLAILAGKGSGVPLLEMPSGLWPVLLVLYLVILLRTFVDFLHRQNEYVFVSQWYLLGAFLWFPWIYATTNFLLFCVDGHPVMDAAVAQWYRSTLLLLFFLPVSLGAAYFLVPKVSGRPVASYPLALLGFWTLAIVAPWSGMQKLAGAPLPQFLPYLGAAATVLILIPALMVGVNLLQTLKGKGGLVVSSPTLRFTVFGVLCFLLFGVASLFLNTQGTLRLTQFSTTGYAFDLLGFYGVFTLSACGAIYFIVPRLTRREWLSRRFISWHFLLSVYGVVVIVSIGLLGGLMQGGSAEAWDKPWATAATLVRGSSWGSVLAWAFLAIGNFFFCVHLLLMWARLGRRSTHPTLLVSAHADSPHGPEGQVDNYGTGTASA